MWGMALAGGILSTRGGEAPALSMGWRMDESYAYRVAVIAHEKEYVASLRGHVVYVVRAANPHGFTLRCHDQLSVQRHSHAGRLFPPFGIFRVGWRHFDGGDVGHKLRAPTDVVVDRQGRWLAVSGSPQAPRDLTDPAMLVLETMPGSLGATWAATNTVRVTLERTLKEEEHSRLVKLDRTPVLAEERVAYRVESATTNLVTVRRQTRLKAQGEDGGVELAGEGLLEFDRAQGVFSSLNFTGQLTRERNGTAAAPIRVEVQYELLRGAAHANALRPRPPASRAERRPLPADELDLCLADLRRLISFPRHRAADTLARAEPQDRRSEVVAALVPVLGDSDSFTRAAACRALAVWGDGAAVPALIARLEDAHLTVRWAAVDAVAALRDPRAALPVARLLASGREMAPAAYALEQMGAAAEPAMMSLLRHPQPEVRRIACSLLATSGSLRSVLPLVEASREGTQPTVVAAARRALREIFQRQGQP